VEIAGRTLEPHLIAAYLLELAQGFQSYYNAHQFLVDDDDTRHGRLRLAFATRQLLENGLDLLGVAAPEVM
jgi:arginyl-tRNA synthetase